ncbi:uncharacterized protein LOC133518798 isoform X5 [Cydia pomonella]|uniref:uncharacterized protein LOC133518798 isoform X5 n=1 Tax=Cydia pomonella TaxID=82600 RepID=UPI002ADDCCFB|nr:uncharacterized protein LOC133518798 isoform X5 [Cydia pomonella]
MNRLILISAVCMQFGWIFGAPNPEGVGAYAYQDSDGNRFPFNGGFSNFGMPNFGPQNYGQYGPNSAYASGSVMPGYSHQVAAVNPGNPNQPNVDIKNRFGEDGKGGNGYMSVSSSSYATSSNVNGQEQAHRGAETVVNNNGVVHRYKVES